jgi:nitrogen fixation NifU-like protein
MQIEIKVAKTYRGHQISNFGCAAAIATSSMVTEMVKGKDSGRSPAVLPIRPWRRPWDGLPPVKMHCSNLAAEALHDAISLTENHIRIVTYIRPVQR